MLDRDLYDAVCRACVTFPVVVVTGPRQSGKTTLLREGWGSSHEYLSMEDPDTRAQVRADPRGFLLRHPPPVIFDEIQYVPDLLPYIKSAVDEDRLPGHWLLTGSQSFPLMQGVTESLAGRAAILRLLPFSTAEAFVNESSRRSIDTILESLFSSPRSEGVWQAGKPDLGDWLLRGGYPEIRANPSVDRLLWCNSYVQTYLERDVRQLLNVGDLNTFDRFLRLAAARSGQVLNLSNLAKDTGISPPTAKHWLSVLEASGTVYLLPPYFRNFGKRMIKSPKLYFLDPALASFLLGLHAPEPLLQGPCMGPLMETAVVSAWVKAFVHRGEKPSLYYWRSRAGLEVDLLVERNGELYPMEVKATATLRPGHGTSLAKWMKLADNEHNPGLIFANVSKATPVAPNVQAIPWYWV